MNDYEAAMAALERAKGLAGDALKALEPVANTIKSSQRQAELLWGSDANANPDAARKLAKVQELIEAARTEITAGGLDLFTASVVLDRLWKGHG